MRRIVIGILCLAVLFFRAEAVLCQSPEYRTVNTSRGNVIVGLNRDRALELFGVPTSASSDLWYYADLQQFVHFSQRSLAQMYLYPPFLELTSTGVPVEFKVFGYLGDFTVKDITAQAEFIISEKENFSTVRPGVFIPKKEGVYQVLASSQDAASNPAFIVIKKPDDKKASAKEQCLAIHVLPYKPRLRPGSRIEFVALGIFFSSSDKSYVVKDISRQAQWFFRQAGQEQPLKEGGMVTAPQEEGKFSVFCTYDGLKSYPQEMEVSAAAFLRPASEVANITVLPEFIFASLNENIMVKAFATYADYSVKEISSRAKWKISDSETLIPFGGGLFACRSEGVSEISALSGEVESQAAKVIVAKIEGDDKAQAKKKELLALQTQNAATKAKDAEQLLEEMKQDARELENSAADEKRTLKAIKIIPDYLKVHLGESGEVAAMGIYSDNTQEDITLLASWEALDPAICSAERGRVSANHKGETRLYAKFEGITSSPATVIVEGPRLLSVSIIPPEATLPMGRTLSLKAEGYYSDASRKDITSEVHWEVTDQRIIKINKKAVVSPIAMGKAQVYAVHKELRSLPAAIQVVFSFLWLFKRIAVALAALLLFAAAFFAMLFAFTEREKRKLQQLIDKDPRGFIVSLHENACHLLSIFGFRPKAFLAPRDYARMADATYMTEKGAFLRFTVKFQEAHYSSHVQRSEDALSALGDYNGFLKTLLSRQSKSALVLRVALALFKTRPLFIPGP